MSGRHVPAAVLALTALIACSRTPPATEPPKHAPAPPPTRPAPPPSAGVRPPSSAEQREIEVLMRETEALRGLRFRAPVRVTIEDRRAMRAYVVQALDEAQLARAHRRYLALGALDPSIDVRATLLAIMEEELIGYYDPREDRLAVRDDVARALGARGSEGADPLAWRATVVHELVHALQDQHFDLDAAVEAVRTTDADNAFAALVEGDATLVMLAYTLARSGQTLSSLTRAPERLRALMARTPAQLTGALRRAPALLREPLLFRYRDGAAFCASLFRAGGWPRVDAAHRSPAASTLEVRALTPQPLASAASALTLPPLGGLAERGLTPVDDDVLGSLEVGVLLGASEREATYIARTWRGDRYLVLAGPSGDASVWWLRFATPGAARLARLRFVQQADRARHVAQLGPLLVVTRGLDRATFAALREATRSALAAGPRPTARARVRARTDTRVDPLATSAGQH